MKQTCALLVAMLLAGLLHHVSAQSQRMGEITVQNKGLGFAYFQDGRQISKNELLLVLDSHPEANRELKTSHRNKMPATLLSYAGGVMLGYPVSTHLTGGRPSWVMAGLGAGLLALSLPFTGAIMKREIHAVSQYNTGLRQASNQTTNMRLEYEITGAAIKITF